MDHFAIHYVSREGDVALKLILLSSFMRATPFAGGQPAPDVSIVLPCLNQARGLPFALANARAGLLGLERELGLTGEIILADAGSRDGSQMIAIAEGVRVVDAPGGGYGATLRGGLAQARGRYLIMGDIDGSCDFRDCVAMVRALMRGVDICVGARMGRQAQSLWQRLFRPFREILLGFFLRWFFGVYLSDATCRLRALSVSTFQALRLQGDGAELTTEMIIKAALLGHRISESPCHSRRSRGRTSAGATLRHLRFFILLSPARFFVVPALLWVIGALALWSAALFGQLHLVASIGRDGAFVLAGVFLCLGHSCSLFALGAYLYACREGFRSAPRSGRWLHRLVSVKGQLGLAAIFAVSGLTLLGLPLLLEMPLPSGLPTGVSLLVLALQSAFAALLVAILKPPEADEEVPPIQPSNIRIVRAEPVRLGM